jgi:hypothetical protein
LHHQPSLTHPNQSLNILLFHYLLVVMQNQYRRAGRIRQLFSLLNGMMSLNFNPNTRLLQTFGFLLNLCRRRNRNQYRNLQL